MDKKVILVTGANKGIGFETVKQLARQGHDVILAARDAAKAARAQQQLATDGLKIHPVHLDLDDEASISSAAQEVKSTFGKLDVLVNNAAILLKEDVSLLRNDLRTTEKTIHTNGLAQLAVAKAFHALIPNGGRIIMASSGGGSMTDPVGGWSPAYCVTKSLVGAMTRHLAHELSSRNIQVNAFDPGWVRTDMGGRAAPRSVERGADIVVWLATAEGIGTGKFFRDRKSIPW